MSVFNPAVISNTSQHQSTTSHTKNLFDEANKKNQEYFPANPNDIINRIRASFYELSRINKSMFEIIQSATNNLNLSDKIIYEIESFLLDHEVNLIHLDIDTLCQYMLEKMETNSEWVLKNILEKDVIALDDPNGCFINGFMNSENKLYSNNANIRDMNRDGSYFKNSNTELYGDNINKGSIFVLISDTMHAGFSEVYYIYDFGMKLRKIGIKKYGSHYNNLHIIIPVHITRLLYDPIKAYAPFIHQHCFQDAGGIMELELQIDNRSHVFNPQYKTFSTVNEDIIIKRYGWNQKHISSSKMAVDKVKESIINDYNPLSFSTVYTITDIGWGGTLVGYCNHLCVNKINLAQFAENVDAENVGYILNYKKEKLSKNMPDGYLQLLISGYYRAIDANKNSIYTGIIALIQHFYKQRAQWNYDPGLKIKNNLITYVSRNYKVSDGDGGIDYDNLNWLHAVSIGEFSSGILKFIVEIKRDDGSIDIGIIESNKVETFNGWFEKCVEESTFAYNTVGKFYIDGKPSKTDPKQILCGGSILLLKLDFNENKLVFLTKKRGKSKWQLLKSAKMDLRKKYKCFVSMCWGRDCVYATYSN